MKELRNICILTFFLNASICVSGQLDLNKMSKSFSFSDTICDPAVQCSTSDQGTLIPDPINCNNYYVCINNQGHITPSDVSIPCQEGSYFDTNSLTCQIETEPCQINCANVCATQCTHQYEVIDYPNDCSKYYICFPDGIQTFSCPPEIPYFNGKECTINEYTCCDFCTATCNDVGIEVADPYDCRKFYICLTIGTPSEDTHFPCPAGEIYNNGGCIKGTECSPICSSSSINSITSTTSTYSTIILTGEPAI